jgi:hypothetical protein
MATVLDERSPVPRAMLPGGGLLSLHEGGERSRRREKGRLRRVLRSRSFAWTLALLVAVSAAGVATYQVGEARRDAARLGAEADAATAELASVTDGASTAASHAASLQQRLAKLQTDYAALKASKVKTVVQTKTVTETKTVTRWVPNGKEVTVELTGFEDRVGVHDVQLTRSYGYTDLIGIAVNRSGEVISYAELGCSFLDADGRLLANGIDNRQDWQPGQSWGFVCSAEVNAAGGILRVGELS